MAGGLSTRRRSNSSSDPASSKATPAAATSSDTVVPSVASSRPKRRACTLSSSSSSATATTNTKNENNAPDPVASSSTNVGGSSSSRTTARTSRAPPRVRSSVPKGNTNSLKAMSPEGKSIALTIKVGGKIISNGDSTTTEVGTTTTTTSIPLGHDGNTFYCHKCGGVGDVVCCDGCPRVYHGDCVPEGPSRDTLDQDRWYCPSCYPTKVGTGIPRTCFECNEKGENMSQCESCAGWIHFPKCPGDDDEDDVLSDDSDTESPRKIALRQKMMVEQKGRILCKICRLEFLEQERIKQEEDNSEVVAAATAATGDNNHDENEEMENDNDDHPEKDDEDSTSVDIDIPKDNEEEEEPEGASPPSPTEEIPTKKTSKRIKTSPQEPQGSSRKRRLSLPSTKIKENLEMDQSEGTPPPTSAAATQPTPSKKAKKEAGQEKKKSKSNTPSKHSSSSSRKNHQEEDNLDAATEILTHSLGYPRALPAFFFFLSENRHRIERHLGRKHRTFIRLPKGLERNELVAQEGALWWSKLKGAEMRRYMETSMQEYEARIIEWKEEKTIRDMFLEHENVDDEYDASFEDEVLTYENHQRLYLGTNVGSKAYKPDPESLTTQNRVLLELLQDSRFHPMPMMQINRRGTEHGQFDFDRVTIPYFDVHGPFSTSVGDECMGCTRGWAHFCPVLKRRLPAVDYRARLQPALSSLMATRVGLGLRPKPLPDPKVPDNIEDFSTWVRPDVQHAHRLPMDETEPLSDPSARADDVVQFIEEIHAMKIPEPPRPEVPNRQEGSNKSNSASDNTSDPMKKRWFDTVGGEGSKAATLMKCGRCRTVICTDTGCIQCRRAQLVINLSRRPPPGQEDSYSSDVPSPLYETRSNPRVEHILKVHTQMCGRASAREGSVEGSNDPDVLVAHGILRQRWTPFAVLPPTTVLSPTPKSRLQRRLPTAEENSSDDDDKATTVTEDTALAKDSNNTSDDVSLSSKGSSGADLPVEEGDDESQATQDRSVNGGDPRSKRLRSTRVAAGTTTISKEDPLKEDLRQGLQNRFKEEAEELQKKCLDRACCGILFALMRRDPLLLFASPVTAEGYTTLIPNPIDFGMIREQVLEGKYTSLGSFIADCRLLCTNALAYNPPGSLYAKCAEEMRGVLAVMQRRAQKWMTVIKDAHAAAHRRTRTEKEASSTLEDVLEVEAHDPFDELRQTWPEAIDFLEDAEWLRRQVEADFMRTRENEMAYYAALAVRRTAAGAEAAMAPYPDSGGIYNVVSRRTHVDDEALRRAIDEHVSGITHPVELKDLPGWREDSIMRILRRAQTRRLDGMSSTNVGCARCDGAADEVKNQSKSSQLSRLTKYRPKRNDQVRIDPSRESLSTGMSSQTTRTRLQSVLGELANEKDWNIKAQVANEVAVTVRGSGIHGWGLYADQYFKKGDIVAEYIGEYVSPAVTERREKLYREHRIQDYQFRLDDSLVIDATLRGGHGRYINHNCNPNCIAKIIPGASPNEHLKRVLIIAQRKIEPREELTYDYQFPLELDLNARIPCNCMSDQCRGFMNWDLPEKGSATQSFRTQKRGANMRDRIRRLGRPLKGEKGGDVDDDEDSS